MTQLASATRPNDDFIQWHDSSVVLHGARKPTDIEMAWVDLVHALKAANYTGAQQLLDTALAKPEGSTLLAMRCKRFNGLGDGETLLEHFAQDQDHEAFAWLLQRGAPWQVSALYGTVEKVNAVSVNLAIRGSVRSLQTLVDTVGDEVLRAEGWHGLSLMHYAFMHDQVSMVAHLLERVPEMLQARDADGNVPEQMRSIQDDGEGNALPLSPQLLDMVRSWRAREAAAAAARAPDPAAAPR